MACPFGSPHEFAATVPNGKKKRRGLTRGADQRGDSIANCLSGRPSDASCQLGDLSALPRRIGCREQQGDELTAAAIASITGSICVEPTNVRHESLSPTFVLVRYNLLAGLKANGVPLMSIGREGLSFNFWPCRPPRIRARTLPRRWRGGMPSIRSLHTTEVPVAPTQRHASYRHNSLAGKGGLPPSI